MAKWLLMRARRWKRMLGDFVSGRQRPIVVVLTRLTPAQRIAIEDMLAMWQSLGSMGSSRWTSFYADGDGNFRPRCYVNGVKAKFTDLLTREERWEKHEYRGEYRIDFDRIAWRLRDRKSACSPARLDPWTAREASGGKDCFKTTA